MAFLLRNILYSAKLNSLHPEKICKEWSLWKTWSGVSHRKSKPQHLGVLLWEQLQCWLCSGEKIQIKEAEKQPKRFWREARSTVTTGKQSANNNVTKHPAEKARMSLLSMRMLERWSYLPATASTNIVYKTWQLHSNWERSLCLLVFKGRSGERLPAALWRVLIIMILCRWFAFRVFFKSGLEISLFSCAKLSFEVILLLTHPWLFMNILTKLKAHFPLRKTRNRFCHWLNCSHNCRRIPKKGILTSFKFFCCKSLLSTMEGCAGYQTQDWGESAFPIKGKWMWMTFINLKVKLVEGSIRYPPTMNIKGHFCNLVTKTDGSRQSRCDRDPPTPTWPRVPSQVFSAFSFGVEGQTSAP